ncbi:MAG: hypothetical protein K9N10_09665 [Deltaproteobacteria bacterium]|nr:hypothetical protein [Deltaproteobacteria bacterium]
MGEAIFSKRPWTNRCIKAGTLLISTPHFYGCFDSTMIMLHNVGQVGQFVFVDQKGGEAKIPSGKIISCFLCTHNAKNANNLKRDQSAFNRSFKNGKMKIFQDKKPNVRT